MSARPVIESEVAENIEKVVEDARLRFPRLWSFEKKSSTPDPFRAANKACRYALESHVELFVGYSDEDLRLITKEFRDASDAAMYEEMEKLGLLAPIEVVGEEELAEVAH